MSTTFSNWNSLHCCTAAAQQVTSELTQRRGWWEFTELTIDRISLTIGRLMIDRSYCWMTLGPVCLVSQVSRLLLRPWEWNPDKGVFSWSSALSFSLINCHLSYALSSSKWISTRASSMHTRCCVFLCASIYLSLSLRPCLCLSL